MARKLLEPPEWLDDKVAAEWREVVARDGISPTVDVAMLEAYCTLIVRWREAAQKVAEEGLIVDGDRRGAIAHPALAIERSLADQIKAWAPLFNRPPARRKAGPLYNATRKSVAAVPDLQADRYAGAVEAVLTYAWLIDEAQRAGIDAMQKASFVLIPSYIKGCAELQITPASLPESAQQKGKGGGKVTKFADAAEARRQRTAS
jgi:P27 family predicted phage terminase small subunit